MNNTQNAAQSLEKTSNIKKAVSRWIEKLTVRLSLQQRIVFIKQISVLIKAGVPLLASLRMIEKQTKSRALKRILGQVIKDIENGQYLATALGKFNYIFGELTINIIAIGEISGNLSNNLEYLAVSLKKAQVLRRKIIGASVYPVFIIMATFGIAIMLTVFFFPKVLPVFKSINYDLPWTTKSLIFISDTLKNYGWLVTIISITTIIAFFLLLRLKWVRHQFDVLLLSLPFFKQLITSYQTANITRTLGLLLNTGVGVVQSFHITSKTTTHSIYKKELQGIADHITKGEKISSRMTQLKKLFAPMVVDLVSVGEATGKLSDTFMYLADNAEQETDDLTKNLSGMIEPLLLIMMGVLVGFIAISIITPIYGITQHLTPK